MPKWIKKFFAKQKPTVNNDHYIKFTLDIHGKLSIDFNFATRQDANAFVCEVGNLLYLTQCSNTTARLAKLVSDIQNQDMSRAILTVWRNLIREEAIETMEGTFNRGIQPTQVFASANKQGENNE